MNRTKLIRYISVILLIIVIVGVVAIYFYKKPLGPALELSTIDSTSKPKIIATSPEFIDPDPSIISTSPLPTINLHGLTTSIPTSQPAISAKTCGLTGQMSMLVIGQATVENGNHVGAGAIRLVVIDFEHSSISVLSLPSELWVDARVLQDPNYPFTTLDRIYYYTYTKNSAQSEALSHIQSTQNLAQSIYDNWGFASDYYLTILQQPFIELVDSLGGIEVNLFTKIVPSDPGFGIFPAGIQHLDGQQTLNFTRLKPTGFQGDDAWGEFERQNLVLKALIQAALSPENLINAPRLLDQARRTVLTNLNIEQINALKCMVEQSGDRVTMLQVEESMITKDAQGHWLPDHRALESLISQTYSP